MSRENKKMLVIGPEELVMVFKAVGAEIEICSNPDQAYKIVLQAKNHQPAPDIAIILLPSSLTEHWPKDYFDQLTGTGLPAVISIPDISGKSNLEKLRRLTERAIGSDITE